MRIVRFLCPAAAAVWLWGCVSDSWRSPSPLFNKESVRLVDYTESPEIKDFAERARNLGNEVYPKIIAMLVEDGRKLPRRFDIVFKHLESGNTAETSGTQITINSDYLIRGQTHAVGWLAHNPTNLDMVLIHEMAHVVQQCSSNAPAYWVEGMADYVRYKLGYVHGREGPQCSAEYPHYTSGYWCAGAFLLYVDGTYGSNVVRRLNTELGRGSYSDMFFARATGKNLDQLWGEFQKTGPFTPQAAEINKFRDSVGYVNGQAPQDLPARAQAYVEQQPGGEVTLAAAAFLRELAEKGQLPGLEKPGRRGGAEGVNLSVGLELVELPMQGKAEVHPVSRRLWCRKSNDPSIYHYIVVQESQEAPWRLHKAWCTAPDGRLIAEYSIP